MLSKIVFMIKLFASFEKFKGRAILVGRLNFIPRNVRGLLNLNKHKTKEVLQSFSQFQVKARVVDSSRLTLLKELKPANCSKGISPVLHVKYL